MINKRKYFDIQDILLGIYWILFEIIVKYQTKYRKYNGVKVSKLQLNIANMLGISGKYINYKIGSYYADIVIPDKRVVVEVNGAVWHQDKQKDLKRAKVITKFGFRVLILQIYDSSIVYNKDSSFYSLLIKYINQLEKYKKKKILYVEINKPIDK